MKTLITSMAMCTMSSIALAQAPAATSPGDLQASPAIAAEAASPAQQSKEPDVAMRDITRALRADEEVPAEAVSVAVHADAVVLSGDVATEAQAARALSIAQQHAGGVRVSSHVEVRDEGNTTQLSPEASGLVREVERALKQDRRTANLGVAVSIDEQQVISLHGLVPSRDSRAAAEEVAARVNGVKSVSSRLVVPGE